MTEIDLGSGVSVEFVNCEHGKESGAIVRFEGGCEGLVSWCAECGRNETWTLESRDPLTLSPSVACQEHPEHHGFIREGRWEPA